MSDHFFMSLALELAERGRGWVEPNPLVGAVVVQDGQVVGQGWHEKFGQAHAEVSALRESGEAASGSDLYVTLEPCCHFGKTPPCTEAVIKAGIRRVVVAMLDPFPQVAGQGAARLREAGIVVEVGIGEAAARRLNAPYLKRLRTGRPWVHAKWAMTLDGKIATRTKKSQWITGEMSRARVHQLRGHMDAIIIGKRTLLADDPLLTARPAGPRTPTRVVLTRSSEGLPDKCRLLESIHDAPILVITSALGAKRLAGWRDRGAELFECEPEADGNLHVKSLLTELARRDMTNVLVEGGGETLGRFRDAGEIDEVHAFIAPKLVGGEGALSPLGGIGTAEIGQANDLTDWRVEHLGDDVLIHGFLSSNA